MDMHSKVKPPIAVEAGIVGTKSMRLVYNGLQEAMGKMYEPNVVYRAILPDFATPTRDAFLDTFLRKSMPTRESKGRRRCLTDGRWRYGIGLRQAYSSK
jgi:hypothetical protein